MSSFTNSQNQSLNLSQLINNLNECANEIGGNLSTTIASHNIAPTLSIVCDSGIDGADEIYFDVEAIDLNYRFGCMCPDGITIKIRKQP